MYKLKNIKKKIFFSIIIPTFNNIFFLKKNLNSIFNQSFKNFEIIIIDNYSDDGTYEYIKKIKKKKIIFIRVKNNGIIAKSRNLGIKVSKGKWLAFIDSDDTWLKKKLEIFYKAIKKNKDVILVSSLYNLIKNNVIMYVHKFKFKNNLYENLLLNGNCFSTSATVVKKKFLYDHKIFFNENKNFATVEDYDLWLNLVKNKAKIFFIEKILTNNVDRCNSMSKNIQHFVNYLSVIRKHLFAKNNNFKSNYLIYIILYLKNFLRIIKFYVKNKII